MTHGIFFYCNSSQWGSVNSKWMRYQLVKGSKGRTTAPSRSNVDRLNSSSTSICRAGTKFNESSCDCLSLFCCSGLCTTFMWQFRFILEVNVLMQLGHRRFWWSFLCWISNCLFTKVFGLFSQVPSTHIQPTPRTRCILLMWSFRNATFEILLLEAAQSGAGCLLQPRNYQQHSLCCW